MRLPDRAFTSIFFVAVLVAVATMTRAAWLETPTIDEYAHLPAGMAGWKHGNFSIYAKNPPLIKLFNASLPLTVLEADLRIDPVDVAPLGWGPWYYGLQFEKQNAPATYLRAFHLARFATILLAVILSVLLWSDLALICGPPLGTAIATGLTLSPTLLAHGHLATVDVGAGLMIYVALRALLRSAQGFAAATRLGLATAAALTAKFTGVLLAPLVIWRWFASGRWAAVTIITTVISIFAAYFFQSPPQFLSEYTFTSKAGRQFAEALPGDLWIPLPKDFVQGFDAQLADTENGEFGNYLNGQTFQGSRLDYNFWALLWKENLIFMVFLVAGPCVFLAGRGWRQMSPTARRRFGGWALAVAVLGVPMVFLNSLQIGLRYLLPLAPPVLLCTAFLWAPFSNLRPRAAQTIGLVLFASCFATAFSAAENPLAYFSPVSRFWGPPEKLLVDSNLDWGQDLYRVRDYLEENPQQGPVWLAYFGHVSPALYGIRHQIPGPDSRGLIIVSPYFLSGLSYITPAPNGAWVTLAPNSFRFLQDESPVARIGSLLVYRRERE